MGSHVRLREVSQGTTPTGCSGQQHALYTLCNNNVVLEFVLQSLIKHSPHTRTAAQHGGVEIFHVRKRQVFVVRSRHSGHLVKLLR